MKCRADLRVCLNCQSYDPRVAQQCRERRAEPVLEKAANAFAGMLQICPPRVEAQIRNEFPGGRGPREAQKTIRRLKVNG